MTIRRGPSKNEESGRAANRNTIIHKTSVDDDTRSGDAERERNKKKKKSEFIEHQKESPSKRRVVLATKKTTNSRTYTSVLVRATTVHRGRVRASMPHWPCSASVNSLTTERDAQGLRRVRTATCGGGGHNFLQRQSTERRIARRNLHANIESRRLDRMRGAGRGREPLCARAAHECESDVLPAGRAPTPKAV